MQFASVNLVYRPEQGWCANVIGPQGSTTHFIPIVKYIQGLHGFFGLEGDPFRGDLPPLIEAKPVKRIKGRRGVARKGKGKEKGKGKGRKRGPRARG